MTSRQRKTKPRRVSPSSSYASSLSTCEEDISKDFDKPRTVCFHHESLLADPFNSPDSDLGMGNHKGNHCSYQNRNNNNSPSTKSSNTRKHSSHKSKDEERPFTSMFSTRAKISRTCKGPSFEISDNACNTSKTKQTVEPYPRRKSSDNNNSFSKKSSSESFIDRLEKACSISDLDQAEPTTPNNGAKHSSHKHKPSKRRSSSRKCGKSEEKSVSKHDDSQTTIKPTPPPIPPLFPKPSDKHIKKFSDATSLPMNKWNLSILAAKTAIRWKSALKHHGDKENLHHAVLSPQTPENSCPISIVESNSKHLKHDANASSHALKLKQCEKEKAETVFSDDPYQYNNPPGGVVQLEQESDELHQAIQTKPSVKLSPAKERFRNLVTAIKVILALSKRMKRGIHVYSKEDEELLREIDVELSGSSEDDHPCDKKSKRPYQSMEHFRKIGKHLYELYKHDQLTDMVVEVCGYTFHVHASVLTCHSAYFASKWKHHQHDMCKKPSDIKTNTVDMLCENLGRKVSAASFQVALQFMYTGEMSIDSDNVAEVWQCATELGMPDIAARCHKYLDHLSSASLLQVMQVTLQSFQQSQSDPNCDLFEEQWRIIANNFSDVIKTSKFMNINVDTLCTLISRGDLKVVSESLVAQAALQWLSYSPRRLQYSQQVISVLRLTQMTAQDLVTLAAEYCSILQDEVIKQNFLEALWYVNCLQYKVPCTLEIQVPEESSNLEDKSSLCDKIGLQGKTSLQYRIGLQNKTISSQDKIGLQNKTVSENQSGLPDKSSLSEKIGSQDKTSSLDKIGIHKKTSSCDKIGLQNQTSSHDKFGVQDKNNNHGVVLHVPQVMITPSSFVSAKLDDSDPGMSDPGSSDDGSSDQKDKTASLPWEEDDDITSRPAAIYAIGGFHPGKDGEIAAESVERFDEANNSWTSVATLPYPRTKHTAVILEDVIYLVGGCTTLPCEVQKPTNSVYRLHMPSGLWFPRQPMREARMYHVTASVEGKIYAIGGQGEEEKILATAERYDATSNTWSSIASPSYSRMAAAIVSHDNNIYIAGGYGFPTSAKETGNVRELIGILKAVECLNVSTLCWSEITPLLMPRSNGAMAVVQNKVYICGGLRQEEDAEDDYVYVTSVDMYEESESRWTTVTQLTEPRYDNGVAAMGSKLYILGGMDLYENTASASVDCYDTQTDTWQKMAPLPVANAGPQCTSN